MADERMTRRQLVGGVALAGAAAVVPIAAVTVAAVRTRPAPLVALDSGDVLTAEWMTSLVDRVNELTEQAP